MGAILGTLGLFGLKKSSEKRSERQASARAGEQALIKRKTNVAEDERRRRQRLLQGDQSLAAQTEQATGRKTLLGQ